MKVSIVTITYNAARTLQRTLDSVACQTYADIEHLVIDGASKDDTVAIAERYQQHSTHTVVIQSEPDRGLYDAMNKGLQKATGDYLVFLNAGDTLYAPDTIETVVQKALASSRIGELMPAVIYGDTAITDSEGHFLHLRTHRPPSPRVPARREGPPPHRRRPPVQRATCLTGSFSHHENWTSASEMDVAVEAGVQLRCRLVTAAAIARSARHSGLRPCGSGRRRTRTAGRFPASGRCAGGRRTRRWCPAACRASGTACWPDRP